jgi:ATP-binding cassette subfamily F protein uup
MSVLSVENLYKTYGEKVLFDYISFSISEKERIGLIGVNGTGKSTLLKVIVGIDSADEGELFHANNFHIEYLPQHPELDEELTVFEQIYFGDSELMKVLRKYEHALKELEVSPENKTKQERIFSLQQKMDQLNAWEASTIAKTVLTKLGINGFDKKVKDLSGGQKKRVAIAKALIQPANLLLLDEPTNHLDNETIEWLEKYLSQYNGALLVITHDRYFLNRVTNKIFEMDQGKLYTYEGNYETFLEKKAEREEQAITGEHKRQNTLRRELEWLRRGAKARTTKQKARIQRVQGLQDKEVKNSNEHLDIAIGSSRLGKKVIEAQSITKSFGDEKFIDDFSYLVIPDERIGIIGPNGSGKSTLLNVLAERVKPESGVVDVGSTVKIGYYTQENVELDGTLKVIEFIREAAEVVNTVDGQVITAEQMLERFMFPRPMQWTYIRKLSGGERRRLYLLRILMAEPNVLFLDEPTNDLDTQVLTILEDYLNQFPGVVITVSHDRYFLDKTVDRLIAFEGNGVIRCFEGNYSAYLEVRQQEKEETKEQKKVLQEETKQPAQKKERKKKLSYKEQQEWNGIEERIAALEQRGEELQEEITHAGSDLSHVQELYREQQKVEQELEQSIERWSELSLLVEEIDQN